MDPHEVDVGVAATDRRTTIPNFDPVPDRVAIAAAELLYSHDDVVDVRRDGDGAGTTAADEGRT